MAPQQSQQNGVKPDIRSGRLSAGDYSCNFADIHPPLTSHQAGLESGRCYFCFDAPCIAACPTGIDIPSFIRKISTGNISGSAKTILEENIFGAMCARVCPTEVLCEDACVRNAGESVPVEIGALQRYATDGILRDGTQFFARGPDSGKTIAVVGAGPAGLSCAHRLAVLGHRVEVLESHDKPGGLNEYGIAAYKVVDEIAAREVTYILSIGGINISYGKSLGRDFSLADLQQDYDGVFLGMGLGGIKPLGLGEDQISGTPDAITYISELRQTNDLAALPVGRRVIVIGGGMTAIDVAVQSRRLGAKDVTIVYRRGREHMGASLTEQEFAQTNGVKILDWAAPVKVLSNEGAATGIEFEHTQLGGDGRAEGTGATFILPADIIFKAIGQSLVGEDLEILMDGGRIVVDDDRRTSLADVWAGGDCIVGGENLTVTAVQDGKIAAEAINRYLAGENDCGELKNG